MSENKSRYRRFRIVLSLLAVLLMMLFFINLLVGSVHIPVDEVISIIFGDGRCEDSISQVIILQTRLPMAITALLAGAALSVSGLLLQTTFNNPLAGPSILGVSTGASLGVAVVMLTLGSYLGSVFGTTSGGYFSILLGAFIGASIVLSLLLLFSSMVRNGTMLLIIGIMVGYLASSAISVLNFFATEQGVHSYVIWGLGNFSGVTMHQLPIYSVAIIIPLIWSVFMSKPLNALLLGTRYAENLGINIKRTRNQLFIITGLLTAVVTAFCGPIGFIGLVVPHVARLMLRSSNHNYLIPATILAGADMALLCTLISVLPTSVGILPINSITPIIGVPIIIYIIFNRKKILYFN